MVFNILWSKKALLDIEDSLEWYSEINSVLPKRFYNEILKKVILLTKNPHLFQIKFDSFRELPLKKFPYIIIYEIIDNKVIIIAVFHTSKNPDKKKSTKTNL